MSGNAFVEDDNGRLFYVKGTVNERAAVCDADKPLVTSMIRREIPKMDAEEFEQLDELAKGMAILTTFLNFSPQENYATFWSALRVDIHGRNRQQSLSHLPIICPLQVETILTHEEGWRRWESIPTDLKMLPRYKRTVLLEAKRRQELLDADKILKRIEEDTRRSEEKQIGMLQAT